MNFHNDGKVNYSEFIATTLSLIKFNKEDRLLSAFRYFDVNGKGYITLDSVIEELKQNNVIVNKKIRFEEFKKLFYMTNNDK